MKASKQRIILTEILSESKHSFLKYGNWYELDPLLLFSKIDWTHYEEDVEVINQVYSEVFDEIVVNKKSLVCYWPLEHLYDAEWFELEKLFKDRGFELEIHKKENEYFGLNELSRTILKQWKGFIYFLLDALMDDLSMNEQMDQIATLSNEHGSIVLFRMEQNGAVRYSFASVLDFFDQLQSVGSGVEEDSNGLPLFNSFIEMIENLLVELDLVSYKTQFSDKQLEKTYYNRISKEFKTNNLIKNWLDTYSLN
jgi:hypothetical protein